MRERVALSAAFVVATLSPVLGKSQGADPVRRRIDSIAMQIVASTGVPSASVGVVKDGVVLYANAYGSAKLDPRASATPDLRYAIGSISKQFTAVAALLLQQDGKLKLDDPVSKYIPGLTRGNDVTVRMLLSHTSGYQDFWPQDYVMPMMLKPTTPQAIADAWAKKPLDFEPDSRWRADRYRSNEDHAPRRNTYRNYRVTFPNRTLRVWTFETPEGQLGQYQVAPTG